MNEDYLRACREEAARLDMAKKWADAHPSMYSLGVRDRASGKPCRSANGKYLEGWHSAGDRYRTGCGVRVGNGDRARGGTAGGT